MPLATTLPLLLLADVTIQRALELDNTFADANIQVDKFCKNVDKYGSNNCNFQWNTNLTVHANATLKKDIDASYSLHADLTLEGIFPLKFTCAACGKPCEFTVPIVKKQVSFDVAPCPVKAASIDKSFNVALPSKSPVEIEAKFAGTISLQDGDSKTVASLDIQGDFK